MGSPATRAGERRRAPFTSVVVFDISNALPTSRRCYGRFAPKVKPHRPFGLPYHPADVRSPAILKPVGRAVPAVTRALDVLELFLDGRAHASATEIGRALDLPRTTVHELVSTLRTRGYLEAAGEAGRFELGRRLFELGNTYAERRDLIVEGQRAAERLAGRCQETVHLTVLDGADVVYVVKVDSTHQVRMVSSVGRRLPAHCTAGGKMLLASLPPEALDRLFPPAAELTALTARSITSPARLREVLDETARRGIAEDDCESTPDVRCLAAPVRDRHARVIAATSISVPTSRWSRQRRGELSGLVRTAASDLSERLGPSPA